MNALLHLRIAPRHRSWLIADLPSLLDLGAFSYSGSDLIQENNCPGPTFTSQEDQTRLKQHACAAVPAPRPSHHPTRVCAALSGPQVRHTHAAVRHPASVGRKTGNSDPSPNPSLQRTPHGCALLNGCSSERNRDSDARAFFVPPLNS